VRLASEELRRRVGDQPTFAVCREGKRSPDVLALKIGKVGGDLVLAHASSEVIQNVVDTNAKTADARFSAPLSRLYRNSLAVVHS
jgi:hypothetical protein